MLEVLEVPGWSTRSIAHGFFSRHGGVSRGIYASLNCGSGSADASECVAENRRRVAAHLGDVRLLSAQQVHGVRVVKVDDQCDRPIEADGLVTREAGVALGILSADCAPVLMIDPEAGVVGAAHAGWKGALAGVTVATLAAMVELGAQRSRVEAVIGPTIAQASYEVDDDFRRRFLEHDPATAQHFIAGVDATRYQFDLEGFLKANLQGQGLAQVIGLGVDTYPEAHGYFSNRRRAHRGEADYGRQISLIVRQPNAVRLS